MLQKTIENERIVREETVSIGNRTLTGNVGDASSRDKLAVTTTTVQATDTDSNNQTGALLVISNIMQIKVL